jgi:hypothetical protein
MTAIIPDEPIWRIAVLKDERTCTARDLPITHRCAEATSSTSWTVEEVKLGFSFIIIESLVFN